MTSLVRRWLHGVVTAFLFMVGCGYSCGSVAGEAPAVLVGGSPQLDQIKLPTGFKIRVYADHVKGARSLTQGPKGVVFVGSRDAGNVYAVIDRDGDHHADEVDVVASGLHSPNGVAWHDDALFVAEISRVLRFDGLATKLAAPAQARALGTLTPKVINDSLPKDEHHGWKFIAFGPDGLLYVPIGAPCNICKSEDARYASITRMHADGSGFEVFASGIRNTVGFAWQPKTHELWFTDNGRDEMGEDVPEDELDHAPRAGMHFGYPFCHANAIPDPELHGKPCNETVQPEALLGPHVAALGMRFYDATSFPASYRGGVFIAEHGSWNRKTPLGYRIAYVPIEGAHGGKPQVFAEGWLKGALAWGRPVDVEVLSDGSLLVSDDKADLIYRIEYTGS